MATITVKKLPLCPKCKSDNRRVFRYHGLGDLLKCFACNYVGSPTPPKRKNR